MLFVLSNKSLLLNPIPIEPYSVTYVRMSHFPFPCSTISCRCHPIIILYCVYLCKIILILTWRTCFACFTYYSNLEYSFYRCDRKTFICFELSTNPNYSNVWLCHKRIKKDNNHMVLSTYSIICAATISTRLL